MMAQSEVEDEEKNTGEDVIQSTIGNFGRWQFTISALMALLKFPIAWFHLSIVFLAPPTQFWCKSPNTTSPEWLATNPYKDIPLRREGLNNGFCEMIDFQDTVNQTISCIYGYEYNRTTFHSSIISEWDLVCDKKRLVDVSQITLMLGVLIGNLFFGVYADRRGRKETLLICIFLQSLFGIAVAWIPWFWGFIAVRFLLAVANGGTIVTSFVMCMEVVGGVWRTVIPIVYQIPFAFGNSIMAGLAYSYRDWRDLQLALSSLSAFFILYFWFVPESPRWLMAVGRNQEAVKILESAAKRNGLDSEKIHAIVARMSSGPTPTRNKISISLLFSTSELRKRSILLCINWLIGGITFYSFSQYVGNVGSNIYLTTAVSGFVALPGTLLCAVVVRRFGRRSTIASAHLLTSLCFLGILAFPLGHYYQDWPRIICAGLGVIGLSISAPALYLFTGELFPTTMRNAGVGTTLMFTRLGSMIAPLVISLQDIYPSLPLMVLGIIAIAQAALVWPLPETKGEALLETVEDLEGNNNNEEELVVEKLNGSYISLPEIAIEH